MPAVARGPREGDGPIGYAGRRKRVYDMPMPWCKVTLRGQNALAEQRSIQSEFEIILAAKGDPKDAGLFMKVTEASDVSLYFSPGAYRIAKGLARC